MEYENNKMYICPKCGFILEGWLIEASRKYDNIIGCKYCGEEYVEHPNMTSKEYSAMVNLSFKDRCELLDTVYMLRFKPLEEFDKIAVENRQIQNRIRIAKYESLPKCPVCNSTNLSKLSTAGKAAKVGLFGIFGAGDIGKTYKCNKCGHKW